MKETNCTECCALGRIEQKDSEIAVTARATFISFVISRSNQARAEVGQVYRRFRRINVTANRNPRVENRLGSGTPVMKSPISSPVGSVKR